MGIVALTRKAERRNHGIKKLKKTNFRPLMRSTINGNQSASRVKGIVILKSFKPESNKQIKKKIAEQPFPCPSRTLLST